MKSPRKTFLLRLSPALYEALETWAAQDLRSVNGQIEYLLRQAVAKRGVKVPEDNEQAREAPKEKGSP